MYVVPPYDNMYEYSDAVIQLLIDDPDVDFSRFDNDGRDGIPNSGDDDGYVDYLVLMPRSRPYDLDGQSDGCSQRFRSVCPVQARGTGQNCKRNRGV